MTKGLFLVICSDKHASLVAVPVLAMQNSNYSMSLIKHTPLTGVHQYVSI